MLMVTVDQLAGDPDRRPPEGGFTQSTSWTLVRQARDGDDATKKAAMQRLALIYYTPVLALFRSALGSRSADAEDAAQSFFERLIEKDFLRNLREEKSFRGFLKTAGRRFLINRWEAEVARRPGGGRSLGGLPEDDAAGPRAPIDDVDVLIDREFKSFLIVQGFKLTHDDLKARGQLRAYEMLCAQVLAPDGVQPDRETLAERFGVTADVVRNQLHVARKAFGRAIRKLASDFSDDPDGELRELGLT